MTRKKQQLLQEQENLLEKYQSNKSTSKEGHYNHDSADSDRDSDPHNMSIDLKDGDVSQTNDIDIKSEPIENHIKDDNDADTTPPTSPCKPPLSINSQTVSNYLYSPSNQDLSTFEQSRLIAMLRDNSQFVQQPPSSTHSEPSDNGQNKLITQSPTTKSHGLPSPPTSSTTSLSLKPPCSQSLQFNNKISPNSKHRHLANIVNNNHRIEVDDVKALDASVFGRFRVSISTINVILLTKSNTSA